MGTRIRIQRKEKSVCLCNYETFPVYNINILSITLTVTATEVLVVNSVVLSLQLDSLILKVFSKLNGPVISVLRLTSKAFSTADLGV